MPKSLLYPTVNLELPIPVNQKHPGALSPIQARKPRNAYLNNPIAAKPSQVRQDGSRSCCICFAALAALWPMKARWKSRTIWSRSSSVTFEISGHDGFGMWSSVPPRKSGRVLARPSSFRLLLATMTCVVTVIFRMLTPYTRNLT